MRCPKCHYLSFDPEPRCRNCGYGFSLSEPDLLLKETDDSPRPLVDLDLRPPTTPVPVHDAHHSAASRPTSADRETSPLSMPVMSPKPVVTEMPPARVRETAPMPVAHERKPRAPRHVHHPRPSAAPTTELPLFVKGMDTNVAVATPDAPRLEDISPSLEVEPAPIEPPPLVEVPTAPRAPLGVRRAPTDLAMPRSATITSTPRKLGPLDRDLLEDLQRIERMERRETAGGYASSEEALDRVGAGKRAAAAALDALLMSGLAAGVLWLTLRWCDLPLGQVASLPFIPTAAFLALVGVGYLLMFTACGGQTLGKMALGLRVVGDESSLEGLTVRQAAYRSLLTLPSVLALGAGFVPALMGDERALHDRLAHTRVVRV